RGELVGIDVSRAGKAVDQVSLHVLSDRPSSPLTAVAYRGNVKIASMNVGPDGLIDFADAQGITSVLCIQSDPNATLTITGLNVRALDPSVAPPSTGLTPLENPDVAFHSSTVSDNETFNFVDVAQKAGVSFNRGGYANSVNGSMLFYNGGAHDPASYTLHKPLSTNGSVGISSVMYVTPTGLKPVPSTHWQAVGNGILLLPGAPRYIVDVMGGSGTFDIAITSGVSTVEVMPSTDMDLKTSVLVVRPVGPAEGWGDMPACVSSENEHAGAGGTVNMYYQVMNDGLGSGQVTARIHIGQTGTAADPVVKEFTTTLNGLANKALSVNVTLQQVNDRATLEVLGPDGQSSIASKQVRPPHGDGGYTDEQRAFIMTEGRGVRIAARIYDVIAHSTDGRIVAYRNATEAEIMRVAALADAEKAAELEKKEEEEEKIAEEITEKLEENEDLGIGGDDSSKFIWDPESGTIIDGGNIPLYRPSGFIPEGVNLSSGWGKIFVGFVQRLLPHANLMATHPTGQEARSIAFDPDFDSFYNYIRLASEEIDIPWDRILDAADLPPTVANQATAQAELVNNLKAVFVQNGHGEIFEANETPVQDLSTLPDTLENRERRERENVILTQIASRLPIDQSAGTWEQTLGSPYHIAGRTLNAIDFNLNTGKDTDYGKLVFAVADGTIESIDENNGGVTILHTMTINGKEKTWRSKYLHMPMETESGENGTEYFIRVREQNPEKPGTFDGPVKDGNWCKVSIGQQLQAGALLGYVGKLSEGKEGGTDGTMKAHLHFEATDAIFGEVNMANVLTRLGIRTYAMGPDEVPNPDHPGSLTKNPTVTWDDVIDEWVIAEQSVIFSREAADSGLDNVWAAWTENISDRRRVGWDNDVERWLQWDSEKNSWFRDADNRRLLWQDYSWLAE
ncbi:MAG: M23 family metallopeptidase, partial [Candidatus Peribacteraceae bacterium]|nr:M23 family metallopeptidase [Candidatus Peribacteraceae bacterium]